MAATSTVVMFEAPRRLETLLKLLEEQGLGDRQAVVCRELTKLHEEVRPGTISELATVYEDKTVKGEVTVVMAGKPTGANAPAAEVDDEAVLAVIHEMEEAGEGRRQVANALKERFGLTRNEAYRRSLETPEVGADD